jgi:hypothetical protein
MTDNERKDGRLHQRQRGWLKPGSSTDGDGIDLELDSALAKYTAVEPRAELEERVLANLRAHRERRMVHAWWRWAAVGAVTLFVLGIGMALRRRTEHPGFVNAADRVARQNRNIQSVPSQVKPSLPAEPAARFRAVGRKSSHEPVVARAPHLPEFPSPEPLSEQEQILERYVAAYPEHAALIAEARTEELHRIEEEMAESMTVGNESSRDRNK